MKKYFKEIVVLIIQLFMFYIFPLFMQFYEPIGMVMIIVFVTLILSILLGFILINKVKYLYPIINCLLFIPSIFIYYNESALVHSLWYLIISVIGIFIGTIIKLIINN